MADKTTLSIIFFCRCASVVCDILSEPIFFCFRQMHPNSTHGLTICVYEHYFDRLCTIRFHIQYSQFCLHWTFMSLHIFFIIFEKHQQIHFCHYCCCYYFFHHQYVKPLQKQTIELIQMENHQKEMFYFSCFFVFVCLMLQNMKESKKRKRNENMVKKNQNNEHTKISFFFD